MPNLIGMVHDHKQGQNFRGVSNIIELMKDIAYRQLHRDLLNLIMEKGYSRVPLYYEQPKNIIGLVLVILSIYCRTHLVLWRLFVFLLLLVNINILRFTITVYHWYYSFLRSTDTQNKVVCPCPTHVRHRHSLDTCPVLYFVSIIRK